MIRLLALLLALCVAGGEARAANLGTNLAAPTDWSTEQPFLDVMKSARRWIGHKPNQWGGVDFDALVEGGVLDENGWPTRIPDDLETIGTLVMTDLPDDAEVYAGRYLLRFEGDGIVEVGGRASNVSYGPGEISFDFTPGLGGVDIRIRRTDRQDTGDYVRAITLVREEWAGRLDAGETFNPLWLASLDGFSTLRFMDWMDTNNSTLSAWEDRPRMSDYSYTWRGVPLAVMMRLAETTGADPWFTLPHLASDDFVHGFAEAARAALPNGAKVYAEFSNEVWNWQFDQAHWARDRAEERWGDGDRWMQAYGARAAEVAGIWSETFAAERDRLVNVISSQTGWIGLETEALEAPRLVAEGGRPPFETFDAYAVTGYFGHSLGTERFAPVLRDLLAESDQAAWETARERGLEGPEADVYAAEHRFDLAIAEAGRELANGALTNGDGDSVAHLLGEVLTHHANVAKEHDLDLIGYEGGTHVSGIGPQIDDETFTEFFIALNYSEAMAGLYTDLIDGWAGLTDGPLVLFTDVLAPTKWGSWGNQRYHGDDNPRWRAIRGAIE